MTTDHQTIAESASCTFSDISITTLAAADDAALDVLTFGVVGLDAKGITTRYSMQESRLAGLSRDSVLGQEFFMTTGICMNNFLVAQRFEDEASLDVILDYVLTYRMRPTPVKLRLLKHVTVATCFILIQR